jgi:hypothetical protein
MKKVNYSQCNQNAQLWYYVNAVNTFKNTTNPYIKARQLAIIRYYLNGKENQKNILDN